MTNLCRAYHVAMAAGLALAASATTAISQPCGTASEAQGAPVYPLPAEGQWGFVDGSGEWQLAPQWRQVRPFAEGIAAVETEDGWGLIDRSGAYLVDPGARDADRVVIAGEAFALSPYKPMSQGCSAATPEGATPHYVTAEGEAWHPPALADEEVLDLGSFSEGLAWVRVKRGKYSAVGWIDTKGEMAIAPDFVDGGNLVNGRAPAAVSADNHGYIDRSGELAFPRKFILQAAGPYADGLAPVELNGEAGFMGESDWAIRNITTADGEERAIKAATPFADGRAGVQPGPVWIDTEGDVAVDPQAGARLSICNEARLPRYHEGLLPLVVGDGTNICGNTPEIAYEGPGDRRSGPEQMLWHLPWARDKLVWLDRDGATAIDSAACRRAPGTPALPVTAEGGGLADGAYRMELTGIVDGETSARRADAPCNRSEFAMDGNNATNAGGPWSLQLSGEATWRDKPVDLSLSLTLPAGIGTGTHAVAGADSDDAASAYLWLSVQDAGPQAPRPATYASTEGTLTLERRDQTAITGEVEMTLASVDNPEDEIRLSATFNEIPYTSGPEVTVVETTGAVTTLDESMPDDPLINFFTPPRAVEDDEELTLSLGKYGPKLELVFPAGHTGAFTAGTDGPVSISFAGVPVSAEGRLSREGDQLSGELTARLGAHDQVEGEGSVTVRFAAIPVEAAE